jgi:hypothetical protein
MIWVEQVTHKGDMKYETTFSVLMPNENKHFGELYLPRRIILKWILNSV